MKVLLTVQNALVNLLGDIMEKNIVVEIKDGIVQAVYCPDETYIVNILDHDDWNRDAGYSHVDHSLDTYYRDVQNYTKQLKNCY